MPKLSKSDREYLERMTERIKSAKITVNERRLLDSLESGYVARDKDGKLYWFEKLPKREGDRWVPEGPFEDLGRIDTLGAKLDFVKWGQAPWVVEMLRDLEVQNDVE